MQGVCNTGRMLYAPTNTKYTPVHGGQLFRLGIERKSFFAKDTYTR